MIFLHFLPLLLWTHTENMTTFYRTCGFRRIHFGVSLITLSAEARLRHVIVTARSCLLHGGGGGLYQPSWDSRYMALVGV